MDKKDKRVKRVFELDYSDLFKKKKPASDAVQTGRKPPDRGAGRDTGR